MVPTDIVETKVTSHTRRDIAGLFTFTATSLHQAQARATVDVDTEMLKCARKMIARTVASWHRVTP